MNKTSIQTPILIYMSIGITVMAIIFGIFSTIKFKNSLHDDVRNTMRILSDDILEHKLYTIDEKELKDIMLSEDNYHYDNYKSYLKYMDFDYTNKQLDDHCLVVKKNLPDGRSLTIYSSGDNIKKQVIKFILHLFLGYIIMLSLIIGLLYMLLNKLLDPLRCLVDYCNDPNTSKPLPTCSGSYEVDSLKEAIINLQENNFQLYKEKEDIFKEAAHEIKTPIAILKARLSLFKEDEITKSEFIQNSMADISTISNKLRELIFLKAIEWDIKQAKESVKMQSQCAMMQQLFNPILEKKDIKIVSDIDDDFSLYIHKEAIARVMQAVFENIFMHTKNGSTIKTYIDSKKHELKIINEIGKESDEILFSSHIGTKLISRLSQKLDYNYETYEKDGFFYTKIKFKAQK